MYCKTLDGKPLEDDGYFGNNILLLNFLKIHGKGKKVGPIVYEYDSNDHNEPIVSLNQAYDFVKFQLVKIKNSIDQYLEKELNPQDTWWDTEDNRVILEQLFQLIRFLEERKLDAVIVST